MVKALGHVYKASQELRRAEVALRFEQSSAIDDLWKMDIEEGLKAIEEHIRLIRLRLEDR